MKTFVLDRSRWYRGLGPDGSMLRRPDDGLMCCIGLYLESCGVPPDDLTERCYPTARGITLPEEAKWLALPHPTLGDVTGKIAKTNDTDGLNDREREAWLTDMFRSQGVAIEFVDRASPAPSSERTEK